MLGHNGSKGDSPFSRMNKYGKWGVTAGENMAWGASTGFNAILQLYLDDGNKSRGHRKNLTNPKFGVMGAYAGAFPVYRTIAVQNFAGTQGHPKGTHSTE